MVDDDDDDEDEDVNNGDGVFNFNGGVAPHGRRFRSLTVAWCLWQSR